MSKSILDKLAADKNQLGFEYQDFVFLEYLIDLEPGETAGLEVLDDVHHQRLNGAKSLVQVKHSVEEGKALTNRDLDLWKTLSNWSQVLDELDEEELEFIFYTNKKITKDSGIVSLLSGDNKDIEAITQEVERVKNDVDEKEKTKEEGSSENPIKKYVDRIFSYSKKGDLFSKIKIIYSTDSIIKRLSKKIQHFSVRESESEEVVHNLLGVLKVKKYELIKDGVKLEVEYEKFRKEFQFDRIIQVSQDRKIDFGRYHKYKSMYQIDPKDGVFAAQLSDIEIDEDEINNLAIEYATTSAFIQKMLIDGEMSDPENDAINEELTCCWDNKHKLIFNGVGVDDEGVHNSHARNCLYQTLSLSVNVSNSLLAAPMVKGKCMELSDMPRIGWRKDWKKKYGDGS